MNLKIKLKALLAVVKQKVFGNSKKYAKSYVSLFLIAALLTATTFAWFSVSNGGEIISDVFKFESSSTLNVNDEESISNHITIDSVKLDEATSVDGRNIFFPTTGTLTNESTEAMTFRDANVGDKNKRYIYKDFTLYGSGDRTYVYVKGFKITVVMDDNDRSKDLVYNGSTEIKYNGNVPQDIVVNPECPIRIAFIDDSQNNPVVFDPTAIIQQYTNTYRSVAAIDEEGRPSTTNAPASSFTDYYYYVGDPVFVLEGRDPVNASMIAWLEGTSPRADELVGKKISIDIELESNYAGYDQIKFVDNTIGDTDENVRSWITTGLPCIVTLTYTDTINDHNGNAVTRTIVMKRTSDTQVSDGGKTYSCPTWVASIPTRVTSNITFNRYSTGDGEQQGIIYNAWYTKSNVNDMFTGSATKDHGALETTRVDSVTGQNFTTYTALRGNGYSTTANITERLSPCVGYWAYNYHGNGTSGGTTTGTVTSDSYNISIYFKIYLSWVKDEIEKYGYTDVYVEFSDGTKEKLQRNTNNKDIMEYMLLSCNKKSGTQITKFYHQNPSTGDKKDYLKLDKNYTILGSNTFIFDITNSDNIITSEQIQ